MNKLECVGELQILLHHYVCGEEYHPNTKWYRETIDVFLRNGLLEKNETNISGICATEKAKVYILKLLETQFPQQVWGYK